MSNTIDYLNDKSEVVFYVDPDKGIIGDYKNNDANIIRNNLRPYIQDLKGEDIRKEKEIAYLKNELSILRANNEAISNNLYQSNKREFERILNEKSILKAMFWNSFFNTSRKLKEDIEKKYNDEKINKLIEKERCQKKTQV